MQRRKQSPPTLKRYCLSCGAAFVARRKTALYCGPNCRTKGCREVHKQTKNAKLTARKPKELELVVIRCVGCDATWLDKRNTLRCYCTSGCKQKSWRKRKAMGIDWKGRKVKS